jgi:hypothetical protein
MTDNIHPFPIVPAPTARPQPVNLDKMLADLMVASDDLARARRAERWDAEVASQPLAFLHFDMAGYAIDMALAHAPLVIFIALAATGLAMAAIQAGVGA